MLTGSQVGFNLLSSHLIGKIYFLLAVGLLFDLALLGQLIQRLHYRLAEGRGKQLARAQTGEILLVTGKTGPKPNKGVQRGGNLRKEGSHRLAQSMFLLQVPEHVLGAVGPVLFLQVPQDDTRGCRRRGRIWGSPPTPSPTPLPGPAGAAVTSSRSLGPAFTHGLSRHQTPELDRSVAPGNAFFR